MKKTGLILVDDHRLFRSGLKHILEATGKYAVLAEASNGIEFLELLKTVTPDLVIMDINMPVMNGIEASRQALEKNPATKILILTMHGDRDLYQVLLDMGIKGYILKDADNEELLLSIQKVLSGESYFSQELLLNVIRESMTGNPVVLSAREKEVLTLIASGLSNHEIAAHLKLSQRTVERHRTNLLEKTGSKNSVRLIIHALKNKWLSLE
ncbi:MAG: response regulator transcription factor [Bacteroidales bacterium]|nr:response regulator transcription factor [Bacteroidales bacterium]